MCIYFNKFKLKLILFFLSLLLFVVILVLTQSRSAWISFYFIIIIYLLLFKGGEGKESIRFILFSVVFLYFCLAEILSRLNQKIDVVGRVDGGFQRLAIWHDFSVFHI